MSLTDPTLFDRIKAWPYYRIALPIAGLVVLLLAVLFLFDRCGTWGEQKDTDKRKQAINANVQEIGNLSNQIANLEIEREGLRVGVNRDMEQLQRDLFGHEEAKREANQALANYQKALNTNSNVNRTAQDLEEVLRRLDQ